MMAERVHFVFYFLLLSQGHSKPLKDLSIELCDTSFRETLDFSVALGDCTTPLPLTVTGYNTTTSLASTASPMTLMVKNNDSDYHFYLWTSSRLSTTIPYESTMGSPASRTTTSFESIVTGLNYQKLNGSLPSEYLRDPLSQDDLEIQPYVEGQPLSLGDSEKLPGIDI